MCADGGTTVGHLRRPLIAGRLALYYAKKGDFQQANDFVKKARAISPSDSNLIYTSAVVKVLGNQSADAVKDLALAMEKGYSVKDAVAEPEFAPLHSRPDYQALIKRYEAKKK